MLVQKMKDELGITFKYTDEAEAEVYLSDVNNYLRTASYRKNYQKALRGKDTGKYVHLDFAYLQELSVIDMHLRFIITDMCLDVEHAMKVQMIKDIENDHTTDGYDIVYDFLSSNEHTRKSIESTITSPFTSNLMQKYFTVEQIEDASKKKTMNSITAYDDCPAWVLVELLSFGDFLRFYEYYYNLRSSLPISRGALNCVRTLRNGAAHNTCILADLNKGVTHPPVEVRNMVSGISGLNSNMKRNKLSSRPTMEFVSLLYVYQKIVSDKVKLHRIADLKDLFYNRMTENRGFFSKNQLIVTTYDFCCAIIEYLFP